MPENRLLSSLSPPNRDLILSRCSEIPLPLKTSLYDAGKTPDYAYFPTSGMVSVVTSMKDGLTAEVAVVGNEGVVGGLRLLGPGRLYTNAMIQLEATGLRISLNELRKLFRSSEEIRDRILEFVQVQAVLVAQIAGCNRLHQADERLARWLLTAQDRTQSDVLYFTQEFLGMMLATRRTTVTLVAGALQRTGVLEYSRGTVKILNREGLEAAACDCYQITKELYTSLYQSHQ